jgi:hypothetical protein
MCVCVRGLGGSLHCGWVGMYVDVGCEMRRQSAMSDLIYLHACCQAGPI